MLIQNSKQNPIDSSLSRTHSTFAFEFVCICIWRAGIRRIPLVYAAQCSLSGTHKILLICLYSIQLNVYRKKGIKINRKIRNEERKSTTKQGIKQNAMKPSKLVAEFGFLLIFLCCLDIFIISNIMDIKHYCLFHLTFAGVFIYTFQSNQQILFPFTHCMRLFTLMNISTNQNPHKPFNEFYLFFRFFFDLSLLYRWIINPDEYVAYAKFFERDSVYANQMKLKRTIWRAGYIATYKSVRLRIYNDSNAVVTNCARWSLVMTLFFLQHFFFKC